MRSRPLVNRLVQAAILSIIAALTPVRLSLASPQFVAQWGTQGAGPGQWGNGFAAAVDDSFHVYIVDETNHRVQKFSSTGAFLLQWGSFGSSSGRFNFPTHIAVDASFNVYVTDTGNNRVQKFNSMGSFLLEWGATGDADTEFREPYGIGVDSNGNVYVVDHGDSNILPPLPQHRHVKKFTANGVFIMKWGSIGPPGPSQFQDPFGLAVSGADNIYVADTNHNDIQAFTSSGTFITRWGTVGTGNAQFMSASEVAVDKNDGNRVYVADFNNHRVQEFTPSGGFLDVWGQFGTAPGSFKGASGIAVDNSGFIYVLDFVNYRLQKFLRTNLIGVGPNIGTTTKLGLSPNPTTTGVNVFVGQSGLPAVLDVLDIAGRTIRHLWSASSAESGRAVYWNLTDDHGRRVRPGLYTVRSKQGPETASARCIVTR